MSFFTKSISPIEKEKRIESVLAMFPLLSRDHFLYSTLDRYNWDLNQAIDTLRRRHEYLESEQRNIERRVEENRIKREKEQREIMLIGKLRDIFGSKFSHDQYSRALTNHRLVLEDAVNYFMGELEREQRKEENARRQRYEEEERRRRQRERDEQVRVERNRDRINDLLLDLKYQTEEQKREIYNSRLFKDVVKDFKDMMEPIRLPQPIPPPQPVYVLPQYPNYMQPQPNLHHHTKPITHNNNNGLDLLSFDPVPVKPNNINNNPFVTSNPFVSQPNPTSPFSNQQQQLPVSTYLFKELKAMFPNTSDSEINSILMSSDGNITVAIQNLLDLNSKR